MASKLDSMHGSKQLASDSPPTDPSKSRHEQLNSKPVNPTISMLKPQASSHAKRDTDPGPSQGISVQPGASAHLCSAGAFGRQNSGHEVAVAIMRRPADTESTRARENAAGDMMRQTDSMVGSESDTQPRGGRMCFSPSPHLPAA
eukprot:TRINITY_DN7744_c0_g1_i1.p2 TRINITY_DN7744_c0_g1~~TRINITY_DN7744_c0_g1_i1.p2  ORF type:complete len:145 (+),score=10.53 TRINITY_DN7744_c0_g1_i1:484-918(+)